MVSSLPKLYASFDLITRRRDTRNSYVCELWHPTKTLLRKRISIALSS